jgi:hypothetical protein
MGSFHYRAEMGYPLGSNECPLAMPELQSFAQIRTISIHPFHAGHYGREAVDELQRLAWSKKGQKYTVGGSTAAD